MPFVEAVDMLREVLADVQLIYLFGSQADGAGHAESDVDLAVLLPRALPARQRWEVQEDLARRLHRSVDLVDLRNASTVMRMQVVSTGRVLYEDSRAARDHFETYVYSSYALLNEERQSILEAIHRRGRVYGQ